MKLKVLLAAAGMMISSGVNNVQAQVTTATNFEGLDCAGVSYNLFSELDAGKIIVISFVMPCIGCVVPSVETQDVVTSYASTFPGRVHMWLADDEGDNDCPLLTGWRNGNGLYIMPTFSDSDFVQHQYGTPGMPKIVVIGGSDHKVYGIFNDMVNTDTLRAAINAALGIPPTKVANATSSQLNTTVFPNPAKGKLNINILAKTGGSGSVTIRDNKGRTIKNSYIKTNYGPNAISVDVDGLATGMYLVEIITNEGVSREKVVIN